jgi:carbonic anhydrase/acetyltransferase-like protein (isoleucine patch superfamily)
VIGARALVTKDVPPLSLVVGNPARVIKRFDLASRQWLPLDKWTAEHESNIPSEEDYAANIRNRYPFAWASLIAASKRSGSF